MSAESDFVQLLPRGEASAERLGALARAIGELRRSPDASAAFDRFWLASYARLRGEHETARVRLAELSAIQSELRASIEKLTAPPWFPATFVRAVETESGRLAEVLQGGTSRLVRCGDGVDVDALAIGEDVYLSHELNVLLAVASGARSRAGEVACVERVLEDGRLALRERDTEVLVYATPECRAAGAGENVRWRRDLMLAFETLESGAPTGLFLTELLAGGAARPLGGLAREQDDVVTLFTQCIAAPHIAERYALDQRNTLLLVGPPGTGKTSLARVAGAALAAATGEQCRFASVKGAQLESPWVGETQRNVRALFRELARDSRPTILFIDEVEAIGRVRGSALGQHHDDKFLSAWLTEIDGLERRRPLGIIAATNRKDLIDQALLERLSGLELTVGRPALEAAREIFAIHLPPTLPYGPNGAGAERTREEIIETALMTLYSPNADNAVAELRFRDGSSRTVGARELMSGRAIEQICRRARRAAALRHARGGEGGVGVPDIEEALSRTLESLSTTLGVATARAALEDLPAELDLVAVEPLRRRPIAPPHRYLHRALSTARGAR